MAEQHRTLTSQWRSIFSLRAGPPQMKADRRNQCSHWPSPLHPVATGLCQTPQLAQLGTGSPRDDRFQAR